MSSIDEDRRISDVFKRIMELWAQLNDNMWAGEEEPILGYIKKSNLLLIENKKATYIEFRR